MQEDNDKAFALYDVSGVARGELGDSLNDIFHEFDSSGIELLDEPKDFDKRDDGVEDLTDLDLSAGHDKSNDSVRVYLREMGMVPLLTREGEIELAKRIERGEAAVKKALSRSWLVVQLLVETMHRLERGSIGILDVLQAPDPQTGQDDEDAAAILIAHFRRVVQEIDKLHRRAQQTSQKLLSTSRSMKPKQHRKLRYEYMRTVVVLSREIRSLPFSGRFQRRLSNALREVVDEIRPVEEEIERIQRAMERHPVPGNVSPATLRRELKTLTAHLQS